MDVKRGVVRLSIRKKTIHLQIERDIQKICCNQVCVNGNRKSPRFERCNNFFSLFCRPFLVHQLDVLLLRRHPYKARRFQYQPKEQVCLANKVIQTHKSLLQHNLPQLRQIKHVLPSWNSKDFLEFLIMLIILYSISMMLLSKLIDF